MTTASVMTAWSFLALLRSPTGTMAQQNVTSDPTSGSDESSSASNDSVMCASTLANGGLYTVSKPADVTTLMIALAGCTGGDFNVTWNGAITLDEPLVVSAQSSLNITGGRRSTGEEGVLDGNNMTSIVELGEGSSLWLSGVTLQNAKQNTGNGGAVNAEAPGSSVFASDTTFSYNTVTSYEGGRGGAIVLGSGSRAKFENCILVGNRAEVAGGGISTLGEVKVSFEGCLLDANQAESRGGAVDIDGGAMVTFTSSSVSNNMARNYGGAVYGSNATVVIDSGSLFLNNSVFGMGAGVYLDVSPSLVAQDDVLDTFYNTSNSCPYDRYAFLQPSSLHCVSCRFS